MPRVYFSCHPKDFERYFEKISDDILKKQNCAIFYPDSTASYSEEELFHDLGQMQLFVMPVTSNLLFDPNRAIDSEFAFAMEKHIPVLPIMQENGLEEYFNKKCGDLQFLDPNSGDLTAISYDEKLEKYLSSVLIGDELAAKVRAAFDAYVFLSYRKKDRKYAQELMRLIHKNDFCRDIAIWYDEFLTPGENFNDSIEDALNKSGLFVMAVTPNLVNEPNYIMSTEYPMAKEKNKPVLPAELVETDRKLLEECYKDIPLCTDAHNESALSDSLLKAVQAMAIRENDSSPEHNFFIGLAYLSGIDVEVDHERAVSLITSAAEAGLPEAMEKLADIYSKNNSSEEYIEKSIYWQKRLIENKRALYNKTHSKRHAFALLSCLSALDNTLGDIHKYAEALELCQQSADICEENIKQLCDDYDFLKEQINTRRRCGWLFKQLGNYNHAFHEYVAAINSTTTLIAKFRKDNDYLLLSKCFVNLGEIREESFDFTNAEKDYLDALKYFLKVQNTEYISRLDQEGHLYLKLGDINKEQNKHQEAISYYKKAQASYEQLVLENETNKLNLSIVYNKIAHSLKHTADIRDATDYYIKASEFALEVYTKSPTIDAQRQLMICNSYLADINRQWKKYDDAEEFYSDALYMSKTLADTIATVESYRDLRVTCDKFAELYEEQNKLKKALQLRIIEFEAIKKAVNSTHHEKDLMNLSTSCNNIASLLNKLEKTEEALNYYMSAYKIRKTLSERSENTTILSALDFSCSCIAQTYLAMGNSESAKIYYQESVAICKQLTESTSSESDFDKLGTSYVDLASVESGETQRDLLVKAHSIYKKLCVSNPQNERFQNNLDALSDYIYDIDKKNQKKGGFFKKLFDKH